MSDAPDPFAEMAEEQISNPVKARMRAAKTREERRQAKAQSDQEILHDLWKRWHDIRLARLKSGPFGGSVTAVAAFLETMTIEDGGELVTLIRYGSWDKADNLTRYLLLGLIDQRIMYLRKAEGLAPFDDSLPYSDEEPTAFEIIREMLT